MKNKFIAMVVMLLLISVASNAQLRKIGGMKGVEGKFGYTGSGFMMAGMYSKYVEGGNYYKIGGEYAYELVDNFFVNSILLNINYNLKVYDLNEIVFFHLNIGGIGGYEMVEENDFVISTNSFVYGPALGGEIECYLDDNLVLIAGGEQRYIFDSSLGNFNYRIYGGIKYVF